TKNVGAGTTPATTTTYYLSLNGTLDASDIVVGGRAVPALAPGASDTGSATVTIPAGTATGSYYLIAQADSGNAVSETSEATNTTSRFMRVGPDLLPITFTAPAGTGAGGAITVSDTTKNVGGGAATATVTAYYLSNNAALDAADIRLGSRPVAALAPGASDSG